MKNNSNNFIKHIRTLALFFAIAFSTVLYAQPMPAGPPPGAEDTDDAGSGDTIPLDGGLAVLLVGAAAFGIKKLRDKRKKDQ